MASLQRHLYVTAGTPGGARGRYRAPGPAPLQPHPQPPRGVKVRAARHGHDPAYRTSIPVTKADVDQLGFTLNLHRHSTPISYYCHVGAYTYYDVVGGGAQDPRRREGMHVGRRGHVVVRRRAKGSLEAEVLAALWAADEPLTPGNVADALGSNLAYTTVQTILGRLHVKGAVARQQAGRAFAYTPVLDDAGLAADRMQAMLDKGGDHVAVLRRFLRTLSTEDETALADLLERQQREGRS